VILALGLSRYPVRRFVMIDTLAAALWAAVYTTIGSIGGRVADHPVWAMVFAVAGAVSLSLVAQAFLKVLAKRRLRATGARRP
jgi:membrane protein DedA with SNARE-associated domain